MGIRNTLLGGEDWQVTGTTQLSAGVDSVVGTIPVDSTASFKNSGLIKINSELMLYGTVDATNFLTVTRGFNDTTPASHSINDDVQETEFFTPTDLNDTMNALLAKIQTLSSFWVNSELYDVYDNFDDDYTTGQAIATINPTDWTLTDDSLISGTVTFITVASQNAGGTNDEARLRATATGGAADEPTGIATAKAINLTVDAHKFVRVFVNGSGDSDDEVPTIIASVSFNKGTNYDEMVDVSGDDVATLSNCLSQIFVVAKGSNEYDCYIGSKLVRTVTDATFQIWVRASAHAGRLDTTTCTVYMDDVRESKGTVD